MKNKNKIRAQYFAALLIAFFSTTFLYSGDGKMEANGNVTLNIYVIVDPDKMDIGPGSQFQTYFTNAAKHYYNAMEGKSRITKFYVYPKENSEGESVADIKVPAPSHQYSRSGENALTAWAYSGVLGKNGKFMNLPQGMMSSNRYGTFTHELGHYGFYLGDCYGGFISELGILDLYWTDIPRPIPPKGASSIAKRVHRSYMISNQYLPYITGLTYDTNDPDLGPNGEVFYSTGGGPGRVTSVMDFNGPEFSTPTSVVKEYELNMKFPGYPYKSSFFGITRTRKADKELTRYQIRNAHWDRHEKSEWEVIREYFPQIPAPPATLTTQSWNSSLAPEFCIVGGIEVGICIDRSGSMGGNPIQQAKSGAISLVNSLAQKEGSKALVSSFASSGSLDLSLREVKNNEATFKNSINALNASGSTNMGGGLIQARDGLGTGEVPKFIVLLSDGDHNTGTHPSSVNFDGIRVFPIGYGNANMSELSALAARTKGQMIQVAGNNVGNAFLKQIKNILNERTALESAPVQMEVGDKLRDSIFVTPNSSAVTFSAAFNPGDIRYRVVSPSRKIYDYRSDEFQDNGQSKLIQIPDPEYGKWSIEAVRTKDARGGTWKSRGKLRTADGITVSKEIHVKSSSLANGLNVSINLTHERIGDLRIELVSPNGTRALLHNLTGGSGKSIKGTYGITLTPATSLSVFNGEPLNGNWSLEVTDFFFGNQGTLKNWSLQSSRIYSVYNSEEVSLDAFVDDTEVFFSAQSVNGGTAVFPEPIKIEASVTGAFPILNASVNALVSMPDGGGRIFQLFDDGSEVNGDAVEGDGVYSGFFDHYGGGNGVYEFDVTAIVGKSSVFGQDFGHNRVDDSATLPNEKPSIFEANQRFQVDVSGVPSFETEVLSVSKFSSVIREAGKDSVGFGGYFTSDNASSMSFRGTSNAVRMSFGDFYFDFPAAHWTRLGRRTKYAARYTNGKALIDYARGGSSKSKYSMNFKRLDLLGAYPAGLLNVPVGLEIGSQFSDSLNVVLDERGALQRYAGETSGPEFFVNSCTVVNSTKARKDAVVFSGKVTGVNFDPESHSIVLSVGPYSIALDKSHFKLKRSTVSYRKRYADGSSVSFSYDYGKGIMKLRASRLTLEDVSSRFSTPVSLDIPGVTGASWSYEIGLNSNRKQSKFRY